MEHVVYTIGWVVVLAGFGFAAVLGTVQMWSALQRFIASHRGTATNVRCPETGQVVKVRIGPNPATRHLCVLSCERFPGQPLHCAAACFPALATPAEENGAE
jgi:hypothetical protein